MVTLPPVIFLNSPENKQGQPQTTSYPAALSQSWSWWSQQLHRLSPRAERLNSWPGYWGGLDLQNSCSQRVLQQQPGLPVSGKRKIWWHGEGGQAFCLRPPAERSHHSGSSLTSLSLGPLPVGRRACMGVPGETVAKDTKRHGFCSRGNPGVSEGSIQGPRTGGKVQQLKAKGSHTDLHGFCNSCKPNGASQCYRIYGTEIKAMQCSFDCTVCVETHLTLSQAADGQAHRVLELCVVPEPMCAGTVPSPSHPLSSPCSQLHETGPIVIPNLQVRKLRYKVDS